MSPMKRLWLLLVLVAGIATSARAHPAEVAVLVSADVDAYHDALSGFREILRHQIVAVYDMEGDPERARELVEEIRTKLKPDLILAVGIWALLAVVSEQIDIPVTFTMVLNPATIVHRGATNITGASMNVPVEESIRLFKRLNPSIRRIGVVFNPTKTGYLVEQARRIVQKEGLGLVAKEVTSPRLAIKAVNSLQEEGVDAIWILPDETVLNPKVLEYTLLQSYRHKVPLLGLSKRQAEMGALLALSFGSSKDIGRQAGELANGILGGSSPAELPFTTARDLMLTVNLKAAKKLGLDIPRSILAQADTVIE